MAESIAIPRRGPFAPPVDEGLVDPWLAADDHRVGLTPLGAALLRVRISRNGRRWIPIARPDPKDQCGHMRARTVGETDGSLDLDALPSRGLDPLSLVLVAEARAEWAAEQRRRRKAATAPPR